MSGNNGRPKYTYIKVDDLFIIAQDLDDPSRVMFFWNPDSIYAEAVQGLMDNFGALKPPDLERQVYFPEIDETVLRRWNGAWWSDEVDGLIKTLAESFLNLRFASPDRTQIVIQDTFWPEFPDGQ